MSLRTGRNKRSALLRVAWVLLLVVTLPGCAAYGQLSFRQDHRLAFTTPQAYALVQQPVALSWTMEDFRVVEPRSDTPRDSAGYFAVFVDRAPVKPGRSLDDVADDDESCKREPKCPDAQYLADHGVYTTTATSIELQVPALESTETVQLHEVTVVLLDSAGNRIGEAAWHVPFKLEKRSVG